MHGVSAMSVFAEVISVRLMVAAISGVLFSVVAIGLAAWLYSPTVLGVRMMMGAGIFIATALLACLVLAVFMLGIHAVRSAASFLPKRDYGYFIASTRILGSGSVVGSPLLPVDGVAPVVATATQVSRAN